MTPNFYWGFSRLLNRNPKRVELNVIQRNTTLKLLHGAFTLSIREKDTIIKYVMNQQEHYKRENLREDFIRLLNENGVDFDEKYFV